MSDLVLTVAEAAERVGVSDWLIYRLIKQGDFPHRRLGRRIVIPVHALERWIDSDETSPSQPRVASHAGGTAALSSHGPVDARPSSNGAAGSESRWQAGDASGTTHEQSSAP